MHHEGWQHKTPLQALQSEASHTTINTSLGSVDLYGNYTIMGPAVIRKVGDNLLVATLKPGGAVSVLQHPGETLVASSEDMNDEDTTCNLVGQYLQLEGPYWLTEDTGTKHGDKLVINVSRVSSGNSIMLLPGGCISHPVNVSPQTMRAR
jgi:hypothetical protein